MDDSNFKFANAESKLPVYREEYVEPHHRSRAVWVVVVALAGLLGASAYYGRSALQKQGIQIDQLFRSQTTLGTLGERVDGAEGKLRELSDGWQSLSPRLTKLEARVQGNLVQTRKYAETLTQQLRQQLNAEMEARTATLDARIVQLESEQEAQRSQVARVEAELKQDVASVREEMGGDVSGLHREIAANARDLGDLSERLDPKRVDFELRTGQTQELIPGVSFEVTGTNPAYQRYRGSLWLLQDRRRVWLHDQSVHEPVRFFHKKTEEPYELVVTDVTNKFVIGYLLVPVRPEAASAVADQRTTTNTTGDNSQTQPIPLATPAPLVVQR